jgi:hypothetical protein
MTTDELKEKHRDILYQENDYDVENHYKLSIQFAIDVLEEIKSKCPLIPWYIEYQNDKIKIMKIDYSIEALETELQRLNKALNPKKYIKLPNATVDEFKAKIKDLEEGIRQLQLKRLKNAFDD